MYVEGAKWLTWRGKKCTLNWILTKLEYSMIILYSGNICFKFYNFGLLGFCKYYIYHKLIIKIVLY